MNKHILSSLTALLAIGTVSNPQAPGADTTLAENSLVQSDNIQLDSFGLPHLKVPPPISLELNSDPALLSFDERALNINSASSSGALATDNTSNQGSTPLNSGSSYEKNLFLASDYLDPTQPSTSLSGSTATGSTAAFREYSEVSKHTQLRRRGPISYSLRINTAGIYDDNIFLSDKGKRGDLQLSIGPLARIQLGSNESKMRIGANYAGAASWFTRTPKERNYDQTLGIDGGWTGGLVKTDLRLGYQTSHSGSRDAGERTGRQVLYTGATASCPLGGKTSADLGADFTKASFDTLLGSHEFRLQGFLNYQVTPKLQFGVGATEGNMEADAGQRQSYTQGLLRIAAQPTGKLGFTASAGNEWRNYDSNQPQTTTPVFALGSSWQATEQTSLSVDARRRTFASAALASQNFESTTVSLTAREMLTATVDASVSVGVEEANYHSTALGVNADRKDEFWFTRLGLDWQIRSNCSVGTFYEFSRNDSSGTQSHAFSRNRVGVSLSVSF